MKYKCINTCIPCFKTPLCLTRSTQISIALNFSLIEYITTCQMRVNLLFSETRTGSAWPCIYANCERLLSRMINMLILIDEVLIELSYKRITTATLLE